MPGSQPFRRLLFNTLRLGFRLVPMPVRTRDRLRQAFLARHHDIVPAGPRGKPAHAHVRRPYLHEGSPLLRHVRRTIAPLPELLPATVVAFYLPQFHPIAENDAWWGPGFTEWRNVTRALPQFEGHAQPRLPADLGFYDLRAPGVMAEQMRMARDYGVGAFCTYFYWFAGKTLLENPLRTWLDDPSLDLPIALCWANENWSRRWDGRADDVLIGQAHSAEDDLAFIAHIAPYLRDPRYLKVEGKPMLLVYRPGLLPEPAATAQRWRAWCRAEGIGEIHLAYVQSFDRVDPASMGFDAAVSFPPNNTRLRPVTAAQRLINPDYTGEVLDWRELASEAMAAPDPSYRLYPAVNPGWDNEARRSGRGRSFVHASPYAFEAWTRHAIDTARRRAPSAPLVFVNAWNEWAEGAILEPDARDGFAWLEAIRRAMQPRLPLQERPCVVIHVTAAHRLDSTVRLVQAMQHPPRIVLTLSRDIEAAVRDEVRRLALDTEVIVGSDDGYGIVPFLRTALRLRDEGEDRVLRVHTGHDPDAGAPLGGLADAGIVDSFMRDTGAGLLVTGHTSHGEGPLDADLAYLLCLMGLGAPGDSAERRAAGGMFWCRLDALRPLLDAPLAEADVTVRVSTEKDGLSSAIEHAIVLAAAHAGYSVRDAAGTATAPPGN